MPLVDILEKLRAVDKECRLLEMTAAALQWDQETHLPPEGVEERAEQLALLEGIAHRRRTDPKTGALLKKLGVCEDNPYGDAQLSPAERDFARVMFRKYSRAVKLPPDFVSEAARAEGLSQAAWVRARADNNFAAFLPHLETMIGIARKKAGYWGFNGSGCSLYDGLLDIYEPGMGEKEITSLFTVLRNRLTALLKKIEGCQAPDCSFLKQEFPVETQAAFSEAVLDYLGFNKQRGRLDISAHPFTTTLGANDIRITTRYFSGNVLSGLFSIIHEAGHAFYEMGFPTEMRGTSLADGASMAIHESQSRFWENVIGRSRPFWEGLLPLFKQYFPRQLNNVTAEQMYQAVNEVKPSPIRVDADEVSYSLHIILRFELEQGLISGTIDPVQLPKIWREKSLEYLGAIAGGEDALSDAQGVLQDIHWSMGSFGYFPSYVLGNLYGLQFNEKLVQDIPGSCDLIARGSFTPIRDWLKDNICRWGCRLEPAELLRRVAGESLAAEPFLQYLENKYGGLYRP